MRNILVLFTVAIFLLAGMSNLEAQNRRGNRGQGKQDITEMAKKTTKMLADKLTLNEKQTKEVESLYLNFYKEKEISTKESKIADKEAKLAERVAGLKTIEAELSKVLTKKQMSEYKKLMERRMSGTSDNKRGQRR